MLDAYLNAFRQYADFQGRARRPDYWWFVLANILIWLIADLITMHHPSVGIGILLVLYGLAILVPSIAVAVRRLHDTDRSGWWWLIQLVPLVGTIWFLVLMCLPSTPGTNRFGAAGA